MARLRHHVLVDAALAATDVTMPWPPPRRPIGIALAATFGIIAERNSCEGPWTTSMSARVSFVSQSLRLPERATQISRNIAARRPRRRDEAAPTTATGKRPE